MDYFTDLLATFLDLDHGNYIAVYGRVRELPESILIRVPKMKGGLKSLERHVGIPLNTSKWDTRLQRVEAVLVFAYLRKIIV